MKSHLSLRHVSLAILVACIGVGLFVLTPDAAAQGGFAGRGGARAEMHGPGPHGAGLGMKGPGGGHMLHRLRDWVETLKEEEPEEYERLMELRREDPDAFRQEIRERIREKIEDRMPESARECQKLRQKYHEADNDREKEEIREDLEDAVEDAFEERLERQEELVDDLEEKLDKLRDRIRKRKDNKDEIIEVRVEQLTRDPDLRW